MATHSATITLPDGSKETYDRWGDSSKFVIFGRDAAGVRTGGRPGVAQWCANEPAARNELPKWQRYGGEWAVLPVPYGAPGRR